MRFARAYGFCILLILHKVSHAYTSSSPPTQGAGIFGSPVVPPLHASHNLANNLVTGPTEVNDPAAAMFMMPHGAWRSSPGSASALGFRTVRPQSHISYPHQENSYAAVIPASPPQRAASAQLTTSHRNGILQVPVMEPVAAAGQPTAVRPPSAPQAASAASPFASSQAVTTTDTTPQPLLTSSRHEPTSSHPGDLPQLKRSSPWLFSATREKLLGAIHFMKYTDEQGSYFHGYDADARAGGSPDSGRSNPSHYHHHVSKGGLPGTNPGAGTGNSEGSTTEDDHSRPSHIQPHLYAYTNLGPGIAPSENLLQKDKPMNHSATSASLYEAGSSEAVLNTSEAVYNHQSSSSPQSLLHQKTPQEQGLQLKQRQRQQPQQQLQQQAQEYHTSPQGPVHISGEHDQQRDTEHEETEEPIQQTHQQLQAKQQLHSPQQKQQHSHLLSQEHQPQPTQQQAAVPLARPPAEIPMSPQVSMQTEDEHLSETDHYARFNVYVSEDGETFADGVRVADAAVSDTVVSPQISQAATAATDPFSVVEHLAVQSHQGTATETLRTPLPLDVETAYYRFFHNSVTTPENHLAPEAYMMKSREDTGTEEGDRTAKVHPPASGNPGDASDESASTAGGVLKASEFLAPDAHTADEEAAYAEGRTFTNGTLVVRKYPATTPNGSAASLASTGSMPAKENHVQSKFTEHNAHDGAQDVARFQAEIDGRREARPVSDTNVAELSLMPADEATLTEADEKREIAAVNCKREKAHIATEESTGNTAAAQGQARRNKPGMHGEMKEFGRPGTDSIFEENLSALLQVNTQVTEDKSQAGGKTENAPYAATTETPLPTQSVNAKGDATPWSLQDGYFLSAAAPPAEVITTALPQNSGSTRQEVDAAFAVSAETESRRPTQTSPAHAVSVSAISTETVANGLSKDPPQAPSLKSLSSGPENAISATSVPSVLARHPPPNAESPTIAPADIAKHNPGDVMSPFSTSKVQLDHAHTPAVPPLRGPPEIKQHAGVRFVAPAEVVQHDPKSMPPSVTPTAATPLRFTDFGVMSNPLSTPGEFSTSAATTAVLQPLPLNPKSALPGVSGFPASAVENVSSPYSLSASYIAPQRVYTPFPGPSIYLLQNARPVYVSPSTKTDLRSTSPPAPVYIGQSIRQEVTGGPPPVYPLGARLYERMIPRAEFILASSTYAEEYLDLFAALYCLFHKWPCNNIQEFAEETRKRQEEMNSSQGAGKIAA